MLSRVLIRRRWTSRVCHKLVINVRFCERETRALLFPSVIYIYILLLNTTCVNTKRENRAETLEEGKCLDRSISSGDASGRHFPWNSFRRLDGFRHRVCVVARSFRHKKSKTLYYRHPRAHTTRIRCRFMAALRFALDSRPCKKKRLRMTRRLKEPPVA